MTRWRQYFLSLSLIGGFYSDTAAYVNDGCKKCPTGTFVPYDNAPGTSARDCIACPQGKSYQTTRTWYQEIHNHIKTVEQISSPFRFCHRALYLIEFSTTTEEIKQRKEKLESNKLRRYVNTWGGLSHQEHL